MPIKSYAYDNASEAFISDVDVYLIDPSGKRVKVLATTNADGEFEIDYPQPGYSVELSNAQYNPVVISDPASRITWAGVGMDIKAGSIGENVIIKSVRKTVAKPDYTVPVAMGSLAVVGFGLWLFRVYG